jgi:hypothetical protein
VVGLVGSVGDVPPKIHERLGYAEAPQAGVKPGNATAELELRIPERPTAIEDRLM